MAGEIVLFSPLAEKNAPWFGLSEQTLMENAGKAVAMEVEKQYGVGKRIAVLCGLGNNGGDGFVASRHWGEKNQVTVFLAGRPERIQQESARKNYAKLPESVKQAIIEKPEDCSQLQERDFDVVVDALLGVGQHGTMREPIRSIVKTVNSWKLPKIALDVPTGYGGKESIRCDRILSLHEAKAPNATVLGIGIPKEWNDWVGPAHVQALQARAPPSHKGENGKVLIVAGGKQYHGSAIFASLAASQLVDLVWACTEKENIPSVKKWSAEVICFPLEKALQKAKQADSILFGPGLDLSKKNRKILDSLLKLRKNTVLDAGALDMIAPQQLHARCCITPHAGEFRRFFRKEKNRELKALSKKYSFTIVLKGTADQIAFQGRVYENRKKPNPLMTAGGTGDVLAGIIAAFAAKNSIQEAALAGTFLNGYAGEMLAQDSAGFSAMDLANSIGKALKGVLEWKPGG